MIMTLSAPVYDVPSYLKNRIRRPTKYTSASVLSTVWKKVVSVLDGTRNDLVHIPVLPLIIGALEELLRC
jgi:hypothetical protein